ncbi:MAG: diguanylate cyclase [Planctomycetes bacterium RBG_16_41_13]|nr:MAG: diguanylate cyclase [Planctomycetes bacterium RBG_16_41_13]
MTKNNVITSVINSPSLPTLPAVASKIISVSTKEDISIREIADLISKDVSLSAKVLKIANSAFYSFPFKISSINQAVSRIGANAIRSLVLSFSFLSVKGVNDAKHFSYEKFLEKSLSSAVAAKLIMGEIDKNDLEEVFIAGLLKEIGELIIACTFPQLYDQVFSQGIIDIIDAEELLAQEEKIIGADHVTVGYEVAKNWGFPSVLLIPIQYHHSPGKYKGNDKKLKLNANVVYLSGLMVNILYSNKPKEFHSKFIEESRTILGFNDKTITDILTNVDGEIVQVAEYFGFNMEKPKPVEDILLEANAALSVINLTYDQMNRELVTTKIQLQKLARELEAKNKSLENLANIDGLTEVYNHRFLQTFLEKEISRSKRKQANFCLVLIDVDNFKSFNDLYGHQTGDFILKELCKLLTLCLREYDILARYGGEEFAVVLADTKVDAAVIVAERMREKVAKHIFIINNMKYNVTASFGVAEIAPHVDTLKRSDLIDNADKALLESKKKGKNRVTVCSQKKKWFR